MKSWAYGACSKGQPLKLIETPTPIPAKGEVVVRVKAASFNRGEIVAAQSSPESSEGKPAGIECAGEVFQLGGSVSGFKLGDRIMGRAKMAFSEFATIQSGDAVHVPTNFSWEEAACTSITYQIAYDMLCGEGNLKKGEWLLITGVPSGVGIATMQIGKLIGTHVVGTSRSQDKLAKLAGHGLDHGLLYDEQEFVNQVMDITDNYGIDLIVNNVGGGVFSKCVDVLAYHGRLATVGHLDGISRAEFNLKAQHKKRLKLFGVSNNLRSAQERAESVTTFICDVLPAMNDRKIVPLIDRIFSFDECDKGFDYMNSYTQVGKIVISV